MSYLAGLELSYSVFLAVLPVRDVTASSIRSVANQMEADRLARERQCAVSVASRGSSSEQDKTAQCKEIDQWVASINSRLRQPQDAQTGD